MKNSFSFKLIFFFGGHLWIISECVYFDYIFSRRRFKSRFSTLCVQYQQQHIILLPLYRVFFFSMRNVLTRSCEDLFNVYLPTYIRWIFMYHLCNVNILNVNSYIYVKRMKKTYLFIFFGYLHIFIVSQRLIQFASPFYKQHFYYYINTFSVTYKITELTTHTHGVSTKVTVRFEWMIKQRAIFRWVSTYKGELFFFSEFVINHSELYIVSVCVFQKPIF